MKYLALLLLLCPSLFADAPDGPKPQRIFDWSFITVHAVYAGSNAFDNYETQRHLGVCAWEGNPDLGRNPTPKAQAIHGLVEFGAVVTGDALLKWYGRHEEMPRWLNILTGSTAAAIGTYKHTHAGMEWVNLCH